MTPDQLHDSSEQGRLLARPGIPRTHGVVGLQPLGIEGHRDGQLYVPSGYQPDHPAPLVLMLHGAGSSGSRGMAGLLPLADEAGLVLLAPDSRALTWDILDGGYGPDVAFIDQALAQTFDRFAIDPSLIAVEGFSDGASYALSIGLTNGDLFSHVIAFSPGFLAPAAQLGASRIFIAHGVHDQVLPIDRCSRRLVPELKEAGYAVEYREFDGPHAVPPEFAARAVRWLLSDEL